jgi:thermitase
MPLTYRIGFIAFALLAALVCCVVYGSATEKVRTQTEGAAAEQPSYPAPEQREYVSGEVIVGLEEDATQADLAALNRQNDATTEEDLPSSDVNLVDLPRDLGVGEAVRVYEASPAVEYAEPNFVVFPSVTPNDANFNRLWGLNNTGQSIGGQAGTADADVDAPEAWNTGTGTPGTVVAVIDEGVDVSHPDLRNNIWRNPGEVPGNGVDDDGNGYVDDVNGWDFTNDDASVYDPDPIDGSGDEHGTHVAGTIAAEGNNGTGITGVNWKAQVMALKFLGPNSGSTVDAVEAINYAAANGADVSNNSWGYVGAPSRTLRDAIARADNAGHLFVAAAGNGGPDGVGDDNDADPNNSNYPSSFTNPNIISVAATDNRDRLASFSNFGATSVDLAAPGVNVASTLPGNTYGFYSGTSMATPHVAGVATLLKSQQPALDDAQLKARIIDGVDPVAGLEGSVLTGGRLNAANALPAGTNADNAVDNAVDNGTDNEAADSIDPTVSQVSPSRTRDRTPRIAATVRDDQPGLTQGDITLAVDGQEEQGGFAYDASTGRLTFDSGKLSLGPHTVEIIATDATGNTATETTTFRVIRR